MKNLILSLVLIIFTISACSFLPNTRPAQSATPTASPTLQETAIPTSSVSPTVPPVPQTGGTTGTATPLPSTGGYGPSNFPADIDPLTGLQVSDPTLLERRPMVIKVANLPRTYRPQWGLSLADIVFEYYTEVGETRFSAVFLGKNADIVGPIRSGRFIDAAIVEGYQAIFAFGYAYQAEMQQFVHSDFADRLVVLVTGSPLYWYNGVVYGDLVVNTADLSSYVTKKGVPNGRQNLDGMYFNANLPGNGQPVQQIYVRYSEEVYNRWDYDVSTARYLRFADNAQAADPSAEQYAQLTDRLTKQPVGADNLIVLNVEYQLYSPGIFDIQLTGSGDGYAFRDGQAYKVKWQRGESNVISLTNPDGSPYAFKPGTTWYEVVGLGTTLAQNGQSWRFTHMMP